MRNRDKTALKKGYDKEKDLMFEISCFRILEPKFFSDIPKRKLFNQSFLPNDLEEFYRELNNGYIRNREEIDMIVERTQKITKNIVGKYWLVKAYLARVITKTEEEQYYLEKAREIKTDFKSLSRKGLIALGKEASNEVADKRKNFRAECY